MICSIRHLYSSLHCVVSQYLQNCEYSDLHLLVSSLVYLLIDAAQLRIIHFLLATYISVPVTGCARLGILFAQSGDEFRSSELIISPKVLIYRAFSWNLPPQPDIHLPETSLAG